MGREGAGSSDTDELITDFEGLPPVVRDAMFITRICDRWKQLPSAVADEPQSMIAVLEYEQMVLQALRRHDD